MANSDRTPRYRSSSAAASGLRSWLARLSGGFSRVSTDGKSIRFEGSVGQPSTVAVGAIEDVGHDRGWRGTRFWIDLAGGERLSAGGLEEGDADALVATIEHNAVVVANEWDERLPVFSNQLDTAFTGNDYVRHSAADPLRRQVETFASELGSLTGDLVLGRLSPAARSARDRLNVMRTESGFEIVARFAGDGVGERLRTDCGAGRGGRNR